MTKPQLISVSPHDLPVGSALPWSIYLRSGELLAPAGFVVSDAQVHQRLMAAHPVRAASGHEAAAPLTDAAANAKDDGRAAARADPLRYLKHNAEGVVLTFQLPGDGEARKAHVEFYGRIPQQSVIVSAPPLGLGTAQSWHNFDGLPMTVQVIFGRSLCLFKTSVLRYAALPSGHLFLRYPQDAVTRSFRQALRVDAQLPASVTMADGSTVPAMITNLSGSGCALASGFVLGQPGTRLSVSLRLKMRDKSRVVSLACVIRSIKGKLAQQMRYGIEFEEQVDETMLLALKSFVYEHLAER